jgi:hypothetical protein
MLRGQCAPRVGQRPKRPKPSDGESHGGSTGEFSDGLLEQHQTATEILRHCAPDESLPDAALDELAAELFRSYDAEEDARAAS